jgi:hypothetical protein
VTTFTAAQLVQIAANDPLNGIGLTTGESDYWFFDGGGAGYFTWDGVTPATAPANGWFHVTQAQLDSFFFVHPDTGMDFYSVTDEDPSVSGILSVQEILDPGEMPPAPGPAIGIVATDASKNEGNSGTTPFTFTLTRSGDTNGTNSVTWTLGGGANPSANALDFAGGVLPSGTVTFGPNETTKTITINVQGDTTFEPNEDFIVTLSHPTNGATIDPLHPSAQGLIINDDAPPPAVLSIAAQSAVKPEGNSGATPFTFTVTRSGDASGTSMATWSVVSAASASANGEDFVGGQFPTGTVTFAPGQTSQTVTVNVQGDTLYETNENFAVKLSNPTGASIDPTHASAGGIIQNDDTASTGSVVFITPISNVKAEGPGSPINFTFAVTRILGSTQSTAPAATVGWQVSAGQNDPIDAAQFFGGTFPSGTITIPEDMFPVTQVGSGISGQSVLLTIPVQGGIDFQSAGVPEQFTVTLFNPSPGSRATQYTIDPQDGTAYGYILDYVPPARPSDFNGDAISDVLWRNSTSGEVDTWLMSNGLLTGGTGVGSASSAWQLLSGAGDFNGDATSDVLWRNSTSGEVDTWLIGGGHITGGAGVSSVSSAWQFAGVGDFNADSTSDVLWRNSNTGEVDTWLMNDGHIVGGGAIGTAASVWQAAGIGDFNGDGTSDILWLNGATGEVDTWLMNNGQMSGGTGVGAVSSAWQALGVGDFNGDGTSDILWRNTNTGEVDTWLINNGQMAGGTMLGTVSSAWQFAGVGDYAGTGTSDLLWRNANTGEVDTWMITNDRLTGGGAIGTAVTVWQSAGMHTG